MSGAACIQQTGCAVGIPLGEHTGEGSVVGDALSFAFQVLGIIDRSSKSTLRTSSGDNDSDGSQGANSSLSVANASTVGE